MKKMISMLLVTASGIASYAADSSIYLCSKYNAAAVGTQSSTYAAYVVNSRAADAVSRSLTITLVEANDVRKGSVAKAEEVELSTKTSSMAYLGKATLQSITGKKALNANIQLTVKAGIPLTLSITDSALDEEANRLRIVLDDCKELKN